MRAWGSWLSWNRRFEPGRYSCSMSKTTRKLGMTNWNLPKNNHLLLLLLLLLHWSHQPRQRMSVFCLKPLSVCLWIDLHPGDDQSTLSRTRGQRDVEAPPLACIFDEIIAAYAMYTYYSSAWRIHFVPPRALSFFFWWNEMIFVIFTTFTIATPVQSLELEML